MTTRTRYDSSLTSLMGSLTAFSTTCEELGICTTIDMSIAPNLDDSTIKIEVWAPDENETFLSFAELKAFNTTQLNRTIKMIYRQIDKYLNNKPIS